MKIIILGQKKLRVLILEAGPELGGRIRQLKLPGFHTEIDVGAEFIHGPDPNCSLHKVIEA